MDSCDVASGCQHVKAATGSGCDDGNACTSGDKCLSTGTCVGGTKDCDDGVACTFDGCDPLGGCSHAAKNGQCDDGVACTTNTCDAKAGCVFTASDAACDDGLACTVDGKCDSKQGCSSVEALFSHSYGGTGSDVLYAFAPLVDGGFALAGYSASTDLPDGQKTAGGNDFWLVRTDAWGHASCADAGGCFSKATKDCDDANACTADQCDAKAGCTHANLADGTACAGAKTCGAGVCK